VGADGATTESSGYDGQDLEEDRWLERWLLALLTALVDGVWRMTFDGSMLVRRLVRWLLARSSALDVSPMALGSFDGSVARSTALCAIVGPKDYVSRSNDLHNRDLDNIMSYD
jgi:hypothetical protein